MAGGVPNLLQGVKVAKPVSGLVKMFNLGPSIESLSLIKPLLSNALKVNKDLTAYYNAGLLRGAREGLRPVISMNGDYPLTLQLTLPRIKNVVTRYNGEIYLPASLLADYYNAYLLPYLAKAADYLGKNLMAIPLGKYKIVVPDITFKNAETGEPVTNLLEDIELYNRKGYKTFTDENNVVHELPFTLQDDLEAFDYPGFPHFLPSVPSIVLPQILYPKLANSYLWMSNHKKPLLWALGLGATGAGIYGVGAGLSHTSNEEGLSDTNDTTTINFSGLDLPIENVILESNDSEPSSSTIIVGGDDGAIDFSGLER